MEFLPKTGARRLALVGGAVALLAGVVIASLMVRERRGREAPPAAGLRRADWLSRPARRTTAAWTLPSRCAVSWPASTWASMTLVECAKRNGVATGALDVGVDQAGNLAAADQAGTDADPAAAAARSVSPVAPGRQAGRPGARRGPRQRSGRRLLALRRRRLAQAARRYDPQRLRPGSVRRPLRAARRGYLRPLDAADPAPGAGQGGGVRRQSQLPPAGRTGRRTAAISSIGWAFGQLALRAAAIRAYRLYPMLLRARSHLAALRRSRARPPAPSAPCRRAARGSAATWSRTRTAS